MAKSSKTPLGGRIFLTLFLGVFFAAGVGFGIMIVRDTLATARTRGWAETPCAIVASEAGLREAPEADEPAYAFRVAYRYDFDGATHTATARRPKDEGFDAFRDAQDLVNRYPAGAETVCYVNPARPSEAVLEHGSLWEAFGILLPLVFMLVGGGGIYLVWKSGKGDKTGKADEEEGGPISAKAAKWSGARVGSIVFAIIFLAASAFLVFWLAPAVLQVLDAKDWDETPCVVEFSRVRSHPGDESTTYSVDILYAYAVDGERYKSSRYGFLGGSSSGHRAKAAVVGRHKPGAETVCYVNPDDPWDAALHREFTAGYLFGLIPLALALVSVVGYALASRCTRRKGAAPQAKWAPKALLRAAASGEPLPAGPVTLKPRTSRFGKLVFFTFFALFWNGIVSVFVTFAVLSWVKGKPEWFLTIFMIPFVLIGLAVVVGVVHSFLGLFGPRPRLTVSAPVVPLGGSLDVEWVMAGNIRSVQRLAVTLEGREEATYTRGTDTVTDKHVFARIPVVEVTDRGAILSGRERLTVPPCAMHSFEADHNKIIWSIRVTADVRRWPDVDDEFPMVVLPIVVQQETET